MALLERHHRHAMSSQHLRQSQSWVQRLTRPSRRCCRTQEEMFSFVTLAEDQTTKKGVVVLEA